MIPEEFKKEYDLYLTMLEEFRKITEYYSSMHKQLSDQFRLCKDLSRKHGLVCIQDKFYTKEEAKEKFVPRLGIMRTDDEVLDTIP